MNSFTTKAKSLWQGPKSLLIYSGIYGSIDKNKIYVVKNQNYNKLFIV